MVGEISVSKQIEAVRRKYDVLIEKEEYNLETYDHSVSRATAPKNIE